MSVRDWAVIPIETISIIVTSLIVSARIWTRRYIQKRFELEDWLIVAATLLSVVLFGGIILAVKVFGYDGSSTDLTGPQLVWASRWLFLAEFLYIIDTCMIKVAILLFYLRLADRRVSRAFVYTVYACIADILVYKTIYLIVICLTCRPLKARWDRLDPAWAATHHDYKCLNEPLNLLIGSTISSTEDLVIAVLPAWLFWDLQMPWKRKVALTSLFLTSTFTCVAGLIRSYFVYQAFWTSADYIHELYWLWIMSGIEVTVGLICSSIPALKPFMAHFKVGSRIRKYCRATSTQVTKATSVILSSHPSSKFTSSKSTTRRQQGITSQSSTLPLYSYDKSGIFDGSTHGRVPTTTSQATSSFDCRGTTATVGGGKNTPGLTVVTEDGCTEMAQRDVKEADKMFISVRSSITVDREQRRASARGGLEHSDDSVSTLDMG